MTPFYISNPDVVFRREEDEAILFHPGSGEVKILNCTGVFIYSLLDGRRHLSEIADLLVHEYDGVGRQEARQDIDAFVDIMASCDFIYTVKSP